LKIPEIVLANLDVAFGRSEPDEEIQDLLKASSGLNLGLHYLSGAIAFDAVITKIDEQLASKILWFDCFVANVDRTVRNTNMPMWHKELWLIDHGASLYFHHSWKDFQEQAKRPFKPVKDHVLLPQAVKLDEVDSAFRKILSKESLASVVSLVPDEWLRMIQLKTPEDKRDVYKDFCRKDSQHLLIKSLGLIFSTSFLCDKFLAASSEKFDGTPELFQLAQIR